MITDRSGYFGGTNYRRVALPHFTPHLAVHAVPCFRVHGPEQSLWFTSLEHFRSIDAYEGAWSDAAKGSLLSVYEQNPDDLSTLGATAQEFLSNVRSSLRKSLFVNCWHMNEDESAAMWKLYSGDLGVAVVSTVGRLIEAFKFSSFSIHISIHIGEVKYRDVAADPSLDPVQCCFRKRRSFRHEHELRIAVFAHSEKTGIAVPLQLNQLIERVYISPVADRWLHGVVKRLLGTPGLYPNVEESQLYERTLR